MYKYWVIIIIVNCFFVGYSQQPSIILKEIIINADKNPLLKHQKQVLPATKINLNKKHNINTDFNQILNTTSGIKTFRGGAEGDNRGYMINGLSGKGIRVFFNYVPYEYAGYGENPSNVPLIFSKSIDIYRGVTPVKLGADILGGAINLNTNENNYFLMASYGMASFGTHKADLQLNTKISNVIRFNFKSFYTNSKNNYVIGGGTNKAIYVTDDFGKKHFKKVKNFHNAFNTYLFRPSLTFEKPNLQTSVWASSSALKREIQHNKFDPTVVVGDAYRENNQFAIGGYFNYYFDDLKNNKIRVNYSYTRDKLYLNDTSKNIYNWEGKIIGANSIGGEILNYSMRPFHFKYYTNRYYFGVNTSYYLKDNHALYFKSTTSFDSRKTDDKLRNVFIQKPSTYLKSLLSLGVHSSFYNKKFENTISIKHYYYHGNIAELHPVNAKPLERQAVEGNFIGIGDALLIKVAKKAIIKTSYEYTTRLPNTDELFGNGFFSYPTNELSPERSHNFNLGYAQSISSFNIEANLFHRNTKDLIMLLATDIRNPQYENKHNVVTNGVEFSFNYRYRFIRLQLNGTFQDLRYKPDKTDDDYFLFNDRLPNTPYIFGNFNTQMLLRKFVKGSLSLNYNTHYTHKYFRLWESQGIKSSKKVIPTQLLHNFSLRYQLKNISITSKINNITNAYAYDRFWTQLPGRSFHIKATLKIN